MSNPAKPIHIINVPLDLGASLRGTDGGPSAFRIAGLKKELEGIGHTVADDIELSVPHPGGKISGDDKLRFKDQILAVCEDLARTVDSTLESGAVPLVIGGDHSIAMGTVSGVAAHLHNKGEKPGLIWFDAHGDMNTPDSSPTGNIHGMPLAHLLGYGDRDLSSIMGMHPAVAPENVALIGIRDIDSVERDFIKASGIHAFTMYDIDRLGMSEVARRAIEVVNDGTAGFHISFDLDGCDPEVIPGTGTTVPGGVSFREAHFLLEECANNGRMISMEVVELNPFLDLVNVSAERAVTLVQSAFGRSIL